MTQEQETLLQTIRARLERIDDGNDMRVMWVEDPNGPWKIIPFPDKDKTGLYQYFIPASGIGIDYDKYGGEKDVLATT